MSESVQIAAFEGGKLQVEATGEKNREVVLALPLNRLIVKMVRVPDANRADPVAYATPILQAMSPYPDEPLTVSCELVREDESGLICLAAALPESAAGDIGDALDDEGLNVTRVDALVLGQLRELWGQLNDGKTGVRRLVLIGSEDCVSLFVLDDDLPSAVRALSNGSDMRREIMLSLLEAEDFGGARQLSEIVAFGNVPTEGLEAFAPIRSLPCEKNGHAGVIERSLEGSSLDALPESWREVLNETRFKAKLRRNLIVAMGFWLLLMGVIFGVPFTYGLLTDYQKSLSKEHAKKYAEVNEMRSKVMLVRKSSDHARGALEILKAISDRLPDDIELSNWNFRRDEGVKFSGEADDPNSVYELKDQLLSIALEAGDGEESEDEEETPRLFGDVRLNGPTTSGKSGRQKFDVDCRYAKEED